MRRKLLSGVLQDRCPENLRKLRKKTPLLESLCSKASRSKGTPGQVFSYEFCEAFKNSFFYIAPPVELEFVFKKFLRCRRSQKSF